MSALPLAVQPSLPGNKMGILKSLLLSLPVLLLSTLFLMGNAFEGTNPDPIRLISSGIAWLAVNICFFLMMRTGKTARYRKVIFIAAALLFVVSFMSNLIQMRGSIVLTEDNIASGETPFCHIVIPMVLIPAALNRTIIFPGSMLGAYGIASMLVIWIGSTLALGKGWCSWVCFYGGLDEGCANLAKKARVKNINKLWTYFPYAMLIFIALTSAAALSPIYCEWFCPFKAVTEYAAITSTKVLIQTVLFYSLFVGLVVVLPFLTRKRTQCGLFCPFGVMQSFTNKVNIYDVRIDPDKCSGCKACMRACPTFSLDETSLSSGKTLISCTKCGECVDTCQKKAISYHIKGTGINSHPTLARVLYLYPAVLLMTAIGGGIIADGLYRLLKLITTGSIL
jgi:polyferredoxin